MREIWRDVVGYEGLYLVSNLGRIKSLYNRPRKSDVLRTHKRKGYPWCHLSKNTVKKGYAVHRLVAIAWLPNPDNKPEVNHKDGNKENAVADNLEWVTTSENLKHAYDVLGRPGRAAPMKNIRGKENPYSLWYEIRWPDGKREHVLGITQFCREQQLHQGALCKVARGEQEHHKNFSARRLSDAEIAEKLT